MKRNAFTLLEVLLALALSGVLIGVLAMAIRTQLKASDSGRVDVARAQLARALLKRIGDDVRAAVWAEPIDPNSMIVPPQSSSQGGASSSGTSGPSMASTSTSSGSGSSTGGSSGAGGSGGSAGSGGGNSGGSGSSSGGQNGSTGSTSSAGTTTTTTSASTTTTTSTTSGSGSSSGGSSGGSGSGGSNSGSGASSTAASTTITTTQNLAQAAMLYAAPTMPGLFGGSNWLQVDLSRLPRTDEAPMPQAMQTTAQGGSQSSDVKTVTYYMAGASGLPPSGAAAAVGGSGKGLLRRELSRASSVAATSGGGSGANATSESLAPEVVRLELQYSNGSGFQSSWDSRQQNGLPRAVKIRVSFLADALDPADNQVVSLIDQRNVVSYELIVAPAASRPAPAWASTMSTMNGGTNSNMPGISTGTGAF